jgi:hypothetical protein
MTIGYSILTVAMARLASNIRKGARREGMRMSASEHEPPGKKISCQGPKTK